MSKILEDFLPNGKFCAYWFDQDVQNKPPWLDENLDNSEAAALRQVTGEEIDELFFMEFGDRPISRFLKGVDPDSEASVKAASLKVLNLCYLSWLRLTADYTAQYDPVQNYAMQESGSDVNTFNGIGVSNTSSKRRNLNKSAETGEYSTDYDNTDNSNYQVQNTPPGGTVTHSVSTYDATTKTESTDQTTPTQGTTTEIGTHGSDAENHTVENKLHTFQRAGNIGVMTATQMIENDSQFWSANNFFDKIAADVASYITIPIYE